MYSFEGDYRRKPQQNLAGASKRNEKSVLLQHAHLERMKREDIRQRNNATLKIQAYTRSYLIRQSIKRRSRQEFDNARSQLTVKFLSLDILEPYVRSVLFFYQPSADLQRFTWLLEQVLANKKEILINNTSWSWRIKWILKHSIELISHNTNSQSTAIPLRVLETFIITCDDIIDNATKRNNYLRDTLIYLINNSYFGNLMSLFEQHIQSLQSTNIMTVPLTARIKCYVNLMKRPLELCSGCEEFYVPVLTKFIYTVLMPTMSEAMRSFLVPALTDLQTWPYIELLIVINKLNISEPTTSLFYTTLSLEPVNFSLSNDYIFVNYIQVLGSLSLTQKAPWNVREFTTGEMEDDNMSTDSGTVTVDHNQDMLRQCMSMLNNEARVNRILSALEYNNDNPLVLEYLCRLCDNLLQTDKLATHKYKLLYMLAFKPLFLRRLWATLLSTPPLLQMISRGIAPTTGDTKKLAPLVAVFCSLFSLLIATLHDNEFFRSDESQNDQNAMPFNTTELVPLSGHLKDICLGLVEIIFSDTRPMVRDNHMRAVIGSMSDTDGGHLSKHDTQIWEYLFKATTGLLRQLHSRDLRRQFCPEGHWISPKPEFDLIWQRRQGVTGGLLKSDKEAPSGPPLSTKELRALTLLRTVPFIVPFNDRVMVLQSLIQKDRSDQQGELSHFMQGPSIHIGVRRNYLYEDALDKLSPENEPELRLKMRVQFINTAGLDEPGVDGGGLFREFLSELLKTSFDPNRGFFRLTKDNMLYPNPKVHLLFDDFPKHYYFIGRMLGKAIYENLLVELPFAEFFLSKIVGIQSDVDIHHLDSLDPVMYRNLLYLKSYKGDVADLGLDFTVLSDELGERRVDELKPKGSQIPVTNANRIEYIHLMADYKLNKEIRPQCYAFKQGLANVIPLEWLQMFNNKEMQVLISGAQIPVDVDDLKQHTNYTGGYATDHPTIKAFWRVVEKFNNKQKGQLLKFVTSCSRPPLLGFKELDPPFCIQNAGSLDRLPTSSTCMNLLKLPEFPDEVTLREKLLYAIQAGAGFELS
ncbi:ubiquitin-protein ligase E3C [Microplitis demolitor]|uniref:ubiquitin-protein ligase E3C n=1 Tax=Microplitis demolitor TaxID=69319 RepID=UPI0004CCD210|nr:ubiquitin-protein ligase E3C [Microplitis demolitor]